MSNSSNNDGLWLLIMGGAILLFIIYVVLPIIAIAGTTGALLGSGHAIYNYGLAAKQNIRFE